MAENENLTPQKKMFCKFYVANGLKHGTNAAIDAGYSEKTAAAQASRLLTTVKVKDEIDRLTKKTTERLEIDAEWHLQKSVELFDKCSQEIPVYDARGKKTEATELVNAGVARSTLQMIGQHRGVGAFVQDSAPEERMTSRERQKRIAELQQEAVGDDG